ncbi:MAG: 16S rRNA (uracil(1498)-N(3))-methyltransferase [Anaerovoracaceae bacterium]
MSRFFVDSNMIGESSITINSKSDVQHITKVLRLRTQDIIDVSDSLMWEYRCEIESIDKHEVVVKILDKQKFAREPKTQISLFQGVPKQGKMDLVVQKSVELGVKNIIPVFMKRTVVSDKGSFYKKIDRMRIIGEEAAKQCQRGLIPTVFDAVGFDEALNLLAENDIVIFPYENEENLTIKKALRDLESKPLKVAIIIGPEGGFSDEEAFELKKKGALCVSLGSTILRTETASIAALAMTMYELEL